ncbi:MAG: methylenetetrahydrofolate reductase C-terminal domain-containing protein [Elusimicrobia bacterium]|nr:methylenetetrahydrofolate reductase C-terminal domain-containing protein [Elusimicrobiota bacterium]
MLITEIKPKEEILAFLKEKKSIFVIQCYGCKEVVYPFDEIQKFLQENSINYVLQDYLCNHEYSKEYINKCKEQIENAEMLLIFSCGVGVQSFSEMLYNNTELKIKGKKVYAGCDTLYVNGFQGLTATEPNCAQCRKCHLNYTCAICPITSCSKSLLNGQCGGVKNGKCEVDKEMDCGWEKIFKKSEKMKDKNCVLDEKIHLHDFKIIP